MELREVEALEKTIGQMEGLRVEIGALAKRSPTDAMNKFKLKFVNAILGGANLLLGPKYFPFADFSSFDEDDVPSNSDVMFMVSQYIEQLERMRADNIIVSPNGRWIYDLTDSSETIRTAAPRKISDKK